MNYWEFCNQAFVPLTKDEMASTEETKASPQEIQYWKGFKMRLAVRHFNADTATQAELDYILNKRPKTKVSNVIYQRAMEREF